MHTYTHRYAYIYAFMHTSEHAYPHYDTVLFFERQAPID